MGTRLLSRFNPLSSVPTIGFGSSLNIKIPLKTLQMHVNLTGVSESIEWLEEITTEESTFNFEDTFTLIEEDEDNGNSPEPQDEGDED